MATVPKRVVLYLVDEIGVMVTVDLTEIALNGTEVAYNFRDDVVATQVAELLRRLAFDIDGTRHLARAHYLAEEAARNLKERADAQEDTDTPF